MKKQLLGVLSTVAATAVVLVLTAHSSAVIDEFTRNNDETQNSSRAEGRFFTVSGMYTGTIDQKMNIGGEEIWLADDTVVWLVGEGTGGLGMSVINRMVSVSGKVIQGIPTARQVFVRPSPVSARPTFVSAADRGKRVPSESDNDVGELAADVAK
jgi:hypothetical protein